MTHVAIPRRTCRVCGSKNLTDIFDLGNQAVSSFITKGNKIMIAPLALVLCGKCGLVQLKYTAPSQDALYRTYWYKYGVNQSMQDALADIVTSVKKRVRLNANDIIVDIGANDGTLLTFYPKNVTKIAFEPAKNLIPELKKHADVVINNYFLASAMPKMYRLAKVITTIAMFYDLEDPNAFVENIASTLAPEGIWVNQMASLSSMLELNMFDNICHEHIEHYSLSALEYLLKNESVTGQTIGELALRYATDLRPFADTRLP